MKYKSKRIKINLILNIIEIKMKNHYFKIINIGNINIRY